MSTYIDRKLFGRRLVELMSDHNDTTYSLAAHLGLSAATISRYTREHSEPKLPTVQAIAERYNVNPLWLMGQPGQDKHADPLNQTKWVPIVGRIACGSPIVAEEYIEGYECVPAKPRVDFCLRAKGDSMIGARILDGDLVYICQQPQVENGEIAAVLIDCEDATLKRFYKLNGSVILRSENPVYPDQVFTKIEARAIKIIGKAIMLKSKVI